MFYVVFILQKYIIVYIYYTHYNLPDIILLFTYYSFFFSIVILKTCI